MKNALIIFISLSILLSCTNEVAPPAPLSAVPAPNQLAWHEMEMNAFVHFTTNTFTGKEWGYGDEQPSVFNPSDQYDADQWVRTFKETGFKGVILTCKHHDGFCLWPSKYTEHSVKNSPWMNGKGDVVRDVMRACKKYELKFGVYLSPWDRNHAEYGSPVYIEYYRNQLKELFNTYGPVFEMWFDGANGGDGYYGGKREKRSIQGSTYYEWPVTLDLVRQMEPEIIFFSDAGPGVRWVGNERGVAGETNWNTITPDTLYAGKAGIEKLLNEGDENGTKWIPAEVDVSIRKGWFYHAEEDSLVKTPEQLFDIYLTSVGRGSTLLLNVPPDRRGLVHEKDVASLKGFRELLDTEFANNLIKGKQVFVGMSPAVVVAPNVGVRDEGERHTAPLARREAHSARSAPRSGKPIHAGNGGARRPESGLSAVGGPSAWMSAASGAPVGSSAEGARGASSGAAGVIAAAPTSRDHQRRCSRTADSSPCIRQRQVAA